MPTDRTANLGLTYTGDAASNANLDKLDAAIGAASARYPVLKCICPQHDWAIGNSTWWPSRSSSVTTALPVSGNSVSVRQVTNRPIRMFKRY